MHLSHDHSFVDAVVVRIGIGYNGPISSKHHRCLQTTGFLLQGKNLRFGQICLIKALSIFCAGPVDVQYTLGHNLSTSINGKGHLGAFCCIGKAITNSGHPAKRLARLKPHRLFPRLSLCTKIPKGTVIAGGLNVGIVCQTKVEVECGVPCCTHHGRIRPSDRCDRIFRYTSMFR